MTKPDKKHGLIWSHQNETLIYPLKDGNLVYSNNLYTPVSKVIHGSGQTLSFKKDDKTIRLKRQGQPHLYVDEQKHEYLVQGDEVFESTKIFHETPMLHEFPIPFPESNVLIQADNLPVLEKLCQTRQGTIDFICIDPPYNTRNETMKYNDVFPIVNNDDFHSSWLSFMDRRLTLAKKLLSKRGLIVINIDENEYPYLKILCDEIFGIDNFIETFIWEKNSTKNNSKTTSTNHEYILCYSKSKKEIEKLGYFRKSKDGMDEVQAIKSRVLNDANISNKKKALENALKTFYKSRPELKGIKHYNKVDDDFRIFRISDVSAPSGNGIFYDVIHPVTKKVCKSPVGGYRYSENTLAKHLENNLLYFGKDETTVPQFKRYLDDVETEVFKSVIRNTNEGCKDLERLFGYIPFNNAKPISLIETFLEMFPKGMDLTCLDFFAGSGSTGHAIMNFNKKNGTKHKFLLITNNENNICDIVTYPRLLKALEKFDYDENLEYIKVLY